MGKFDGCLLYSDIDGTFLDDDGNTIDKNMSAIKYFMSEGGKFGLATGRANHSCDNYALLAGINAPGICYNGAMVYDFKREQHIYLEMPTEKSKDYIDDIIKQYPNIGVEFVYKDKILCCNENEAILRHFKYEEFKCEMTTFDKVVDGWIKVLLVDDKDIITEVDNMVREKRFNEANFMRSSPYFLEMIPKNASKGNALLWVANHLGIDENKTFAVGDYYNDVSMIKSASIGAFVENAPDDLKRQVGLVLCKNTDGAIAEFISKIEEYISSK